MTTPMKIIPSLICAGGLWAATALAQSPVTLTIDTRASGAAIVDDFIGLSFGMKVLPPDKEGAHFFSPTNAPLITLFQNLGIRHLRVGGTTVESPPATPIPGEADMDNLFAFARSAGVKKIIYSLRLLETDPAQQYAATNAAIAKYIWSHYQPSLDCFALGNEPDRKSIYETPNRSKLRGICPATGTTSVVDTSPFLLGCLVAECTRLTTSSVVPSPTVPI